MSRLLKFSLLLLAPLVTADETHINVVLSKLEKEVEANVRPSKFPVHLLGIEDDLLRLPDQAKLQAIIRSLELSVGMLGMRNHAVPLDRSVNRWPDFDWKKYGSPPLFGGASPDSISDPTTREAYVKALEAHDLLLSKVTAELLFLQDVDYFLSLTRRVIESSDNQEAILEAAVKYLSTSDVPQSAAEYIRERLFDPESEETTSTTQPRSEKKMVAADSHSEVSLPTSEPFVQPPAQKKELEAKPSVSSSSEEPASSTPWSLIVVLIVAATGLLWLLVKNRK